MIYKERTLLHRWLRVEKGGLRCVMCVYVLAGSTVRVVSVAGTEGTESEEEITLGSLTADIVLLCNKVGNVWVRVAPPGRREVLHVRRHA